MCAAAFSCILEGSRFLPFSLPCLNSDFHPRSGEILRVQLFFDASMKSCLIPVSLLCLNSDVHPRLGEILREQLLFDDCVHENNYARMCP